MKRTYCKYIFDDNVKQPNTTRWRKRKQLNASTTLDKSHHIENPSHIVIEHVEDILV